MVAERAGLFFTRLLLLLPGLFEPLEFFLVRVGVTLPTDFLTTPFESSTVMPTTSTSSPLARSLE